MNLRSVGRWLADWRNGATLLATVLVALLAVVVADGRHARDAALHGLTAQANQSRSAQEAASRRIDMLTGEITNLRAELDQVLVATTDEQRQQAVDDANQRRTTTTATTAPSNPTASAPPGPAQPSAPATTTTTAPPPPSPTTPPTTAAPCVTVPVVGGCIPGRSSRSSTAGRAVVSTAYCETGRMANGENTYIGAVAGNLWPLGTVLEVSDSPYGPGLFTVADRIGSGSELDFATPGDCSTAIQWGRRPVTVIGVNP